MKLPKAALTLFVVCLVIIGATALAFAPPRSAAPPSVNLTGQLLVANRQLADPNFSHCVIYLIAHTEEGSMGLVVNRVYGTSTLSALLGAFGIKSGEKREVTLHYGGPLEAGRGFVLHSDDYAGASTQLFGQHIALSTGLDVMRAVAAGHGPKRTVFALGYAGWGAGQLEHELARSDWLVAPADASLIFSDDPATVWEKAMLRAGIVL